MKRLILIIAFVYGVGLLTLAGWHLAHSKEGSQTVWIIFTSDQEDGVQIYRIRIDGSHLQKLSHGDNRNYNPKITSNQKRIIFESEYYPGYINLYQMRLNGTQVQNISKNIVGYFLAFSPDGQWIYLKNYFDVVLYRIRLDGSQVENLTNKIGDIEFEQFIPYQGWIFGVSLDGDIYRMGLDGSELQNLSNSPAIERGLQISPDGEWIIFHSSMNDDVKIYRMRLDGSQLEKLRQSSSNDFNVMITPDNQWIVFQAMSKRIQISIECI